MSGDVDHRELLRLAESVAREAAALVRERRRDGVEVTGTKSSDIDIVTRVDQESEDLIRRLILDARPDDGFLGEEGHDEAGTSGVRWIVDPIDGTVNFLYGIPQYAISVAAECDGVTVAGVVLDVAADAAYTAVRTTSADGASLVDARREGVPLQVRGPAPLHQRLVATGFHYVTELRELQAAAVGRLLPRVRDIRRLGACALDLCHVAEGRLDGYVEEGVKPWDHAAGALVAEGAGARVELLRGAGGNDLVLCAPAHGYDALLDAVQEAGFTTPTGE
ncbi:inositol monophosphatase family protein [Nocardioides sp. GCM10027113]|uniref:inositol monophosphatase family protein n=1 Tax=unclassified Nocardioides TaxID=2615069 RepID=UPI0036243D3F